MQTMSQIRQRREEILREVAGLEFIRRGSVTEQLVHPRGRNGRQYTCGPYPLFSYKRKGRTLSRRLTAAESGRIRAEVDAGHRFQELMQELMELGEAACGLGETPNAKKKNVDFLVERELEASRIVERIRKEKAPDMEAWEEAVLQASLAAGASALGTVLSTLGGGRRKDPVVCSCGARMHSAGLRSKRVITVLGAVVFTRSLFICPACGNAHFPADQALDMEHTAFSPGVRRLMARAGASRSFGHAEEDLRIFAHIDVDRRDIERVAEALGAQIEDLQARTPAAPLGELPPIPVLYVEYDGTAAPMRKGELAGHKGKQPGTDPKGREVKLGCVFTQSGCDEEGYAVRDEGSTTYVAGIESSNFFGERIYNEALRRGIEQAARVVVLTDGAAYNRTIKNLHFHGALHIVDLYHAGEHLTALMDLLRIVPSDRKKWLDWLEGGRIDALATEAKQHLPSHGKRRKEAKREINFFMKNEKRMQYAEFRRQRLFVGSGVIEAGCRTAVGTRCKQSGMFWSVRGAHAILQLRCCILSGRFDAAWEDLACDRRFPGKVPAA